MITEMINWWTVDCFMYDLCIFFKRKQFFMQNHDTRSMVNQATGRALRSERVFCSNRFQQN